MSRDLKRAVDRSGLFFKVVHITGLFTLGLMIAGVRSGIVEAQAPPAGATEAATDSTETRDDPQAEDAALGPVASLAAYLPANALYVVTAKPREILNDPAIAPHAKEIAELIAESAPDEWDVLRESGVAPRNIEAMAIGRLRDRNELVMAVRTAKPIDRAVIGKAGGASAVVLGGVVYELPGVGLLALPDERTILIAGELETISAMLVDGQVHRTRSPWAELAGRLSDPALAVLINGNIVWNEIHSEFHEDLQRGRAPTYIEPVLSILGHARLAGLAVRLDEKPGLIAYIEGEADDSAHRIAETLEELAALGRGTLRQYKNRIGEPTESEREIAEILVPLAENFLEDVTIRRKGGDVHLAWDSAGAETILALVLPALRKAHRAAELTQAKHNLKRIALAFHSYHDTLGFFPPAVIEENGVKHSWRVAILPFIGEAALYEQYRKDEPWDSEHNKKLLAEMPEVFRSPGDDSEAKSTSYYLLTSEHAVGHARPAETIRGPLIPGGDNQEDNRSKVTFRTLFTDKPVDIGAGGNGPRIANVIDGTSNTIMVVEASRNVPWTKPEDIPVDPEELDELLKEDLGGIHKELFFAALCDGRALPIPKTIDLDTLSKLIMPSDGQPIDIPNGSRVPIGE